MGFSIGIRDPVSTRSNRGSRLGDTLPAYPSDSRNLSKGNILPCPRLYNSRSLEVAESTGQRTGHSGGRTWDICQFGRRATDDGTSTYTLQVLCFFNVPAFLIFVILVYRIIRWACRSRSLDAKRSNLVARSLLAAEAGMWFLLFFPKPQMLPTG